MAATADAFEEHLCVIAALKDSYMRRDDAASVEQINTMTEELAQLCTVREDEVKAAIKALSRRVAVAEQDAAYPNPEDAHEQRVAELRVAAAEAHDDVERLEGELKDLEEQRQRLKLRLAELQRRGDEVDRMVAEAEPRARHQISLYAHISNLTWHLGDPRRVSGEVSVPASGDIRPFDFAAAAATEYEAVNRLWDLMDA